MSNRWMPRPLAVAGFALALLTMGHGAARGDDRDLLRNSTGEPYVFILLDTSGSMNWSPKCTQAQFNAGECKVLCPTGDCYVPAQADDPGSKFYQAKQALHEVLEQVDGVQFGFATYNQDQLSVRAKHWLYKAAGGGVVIPGFGAFPPAGAQEVFGYSWGCDTGANDHEIGCTSAKPADLDDAWETGRAQRLSKGGTAFNQLVDFYVRAAGVTYRARYQPAGGSYGSDITVSVIVSRCTNAACSSTTAAGTTAVTWKVVSDFFSWDNAGNNPSRTNPELSYFSGAATDSAAGNTCAGWDPNTDSAADRAGNYSLRFPTDSSDPRGALFSLGDVIPLDWKTDHRNDILRRLAPNNALDPVAAPDFRMATYFEDLPQGSEAFLRLKSEAARPLIASGSTPLGNSVKAFRTWLAGCGQGTCPRGGGWAGIAAAADPDWACRRKFLLVITDGDDTCGGADACSGTASLFAQEGVKTYVVAFGVENTSGNRLTCMAANGGSGSPIYPQNKDELVLALSSIFGQIREEASAFASAAVPSVQAEVADRIYLSSFTPLNSAAVWDGHLDAYLKPLPLTADGKPDRNRACGGAPRSSCHLWDAGDVIVGQAPTAASLGPGVNESSLKLGLGDGQRRVFYAKAGFGGLVPRTLRLFSPPAGAPQASPDWSDLWTGLNLPAPAAAADYAATKTRVESIIARTLEVKTATVERPGQPSLDIEYVLGDIFHSDPVMIDRPNDFSFYSSNLYAKAGAVNCSGDPGYRCYADQHRRRRKMLAVGSNDGQLHFFEAGVWNPATKQFSDGTGRELFSYMPRLALPIVRDLAEDNRQIFGVDATPRIDDVFLDPRHGGTPDPDQREWRTVMVGGFREGGKRDGGGFLAGFVSGYYALDVTQPDQLDSANVPTGQQVVPSCLTTQNTAASGCGTLPFPAVLWEFTDSITTSRLDEDQNGFADLGETWSVPTVGRIRVIENGKLADKFVAIFGGGMDAESKASPKRGNWLYMVDVETGQAIYKRPLTGAAPADPAALDVDLDGYLDTIYIGTTAGFLYKVDISSPARINAVSLPANKALPPLAAAAQVRRITDTGWSPFPIFDTQGRPIYFAPTAFYVSRLNRFALGFGTGDREDLWAFNNQAGRFYLVIDEGFTAAQFSSGTLPRDENDYQAIDAGGGNAASGSDYVLSPPAGRDRGWYIRLDPDERVITQTFGLSGIVIFSSFQPQIVVSGGSGGNNGNGGGGRRDSDAVCARGGDSRIFVVYAGNGNSIMEVDGTPSRFRKVPEFVTNPYVEQGATKNAANNGANSEQLDAAQKDIMKELKKFFPKGTKFANYWISVSGIRSDTGYERYATIPVGIMERNWKEH
ncbi:MAG: pilus assembly protein [Thermoanaerobaculia bacterium]